MGLGQPALEPPEQVGRRLGETEQLQEGRRELAADMTLWPGHSNRLGALPRPLLSAYYFNKVHAARRQAHLKTPGTFTSYQREEGQRAVILGVASSPTAFHREQKTKASQALCCHRKSQEAPVRPAHPPQRVPGLGKPSSRAQLIWDKAEPLLPGGQAGTREAKHPHQSHLSKCPRERDCLVWPRLFWACTGPRGIHGAAWEGARSRGYPGGFLALPRHNSNEQRPN